MAIGLAELPMGSWVNVNGSPSSDPFRYRVARSSDPGGAELGRGGIGRVLRAFDERLGREVALKELLPQPGGRIPPRLEERFFREARIAARLEHPNVVPIYDLGWSADGRPFFTMKLVRGRTLAAALDESPTLVERMLLLEHVVALGQALAHAHERSVVHCDLKPDNLMIGAFGETVVLDWGLAHVVGFEDVPFEIAGTKWLRRAAEGRGTLAGRVRGTPAYLSPEQAAGQVERFDERTDVWGLGAVLYEVLTGWPPYAAETPEAALARVRDRRATPVRSLEPSVPAALAEVAERALQHRPADRFPTARTFVAALEPYLPAPHAGARMGPVAAGGREAPAARPGRFSLVGRWRFR